MLYFYSYEALHTYLNIKFEIFPHKTRESFTPYLRRKKANFSALRLQSCNSAAPKRANNKIGFGHPCLGAYVARDSKGGFSEGGQRHGGVRRGRAARSKTPRSNSVPST